MIPERIVSLVPSLTELLISLGVSGSLAGRTRFCTEPPAETEKIPVIGGTKNPSTEKIRNLSPDLIIANREENRREDVLLLEQDFPVLVTDIRTIEDALLTIHEIGNVCGAGKEAAGLIAEISRELENIPAENPLRVAYLIWREPWMSVGSGTYIDSVLTRWNLVNVFAGKKRYPVIKPEDLSAAKPDCILLSSEPFPFGEKHRKEVEEFCPGCMPLLVDGRWFSWYGSRMLPSFRSLNLFRRAVA